MATTWSKGELRTEGVTLGQSLLAGGIAAGPLFIGMSLIQAFTRRGFDLRRHPVSLLLLGDQGWIQLATFALTGLLAIACAVGLRRALHPGRAGTWGPLFVGLYGLSLIVAGVFPPDPSFGFPPGAPQGVPAVQSASSMVHGLAFMVCALSVIAGSIVFASRFAAMKERGWQIYCTATAVSVPVLLGVGMPMSMRGSGGLPLLGVALVMFSWLALVADHVMAAYRGR